MTLTIGDDAITSDRTAYTARVLADDEHGGKCCGSPGAP